MPLHLTEHDVSRLVGIDDALSAVESVGRSMAAGEVVFTPRNRLRMQNGFLHFMPASLEKEGVFGYKAYTSFRGQSKFLVYLFDNSSGKLLAVIEADKLGQLRTGAASGVATRVLSKKNVEYLGLIGSGYQAETQLMALARVREFKAAKVFSRNHDHAEEFCEKMQKEVRLSLKAVKDVTEVAEADVIVTATSAATPVLNGDYLRVGCHVNAIGANTLIKRELDEKTVERAGVIVIDSREQGKLECGDFIPLTEKGKLHWNNILEFQDLFNGHAKRSSEKEITIFKSQGIAPWDVSLAKFLYQRATEEKAGRQIDL
ncbi:MAG TPA: ornithine cyclodeaminase family protein [Candidatus Kryptonia bacterium]